jgi:DOPA 4,5-dioxygenase
MATTPAQPIGDFHAHIYFDPHELDRARALASRAAELFDISIGRFHTAPVGPHPRGSVQLTVPPERFGTLASWLALNRAGLTIFAHASTGDDWVDHTEHVVWFGSSEPLHLDALR